MLIDLHAHVLTEDMLEQAGHWGPSWEIDADGHRHLRVGEWVLSMSTEERAARTQKQTDPLHRRSLSDPGARLELMDRYGFDQMVLSIPVHCFLYWAEPDTGVRFAQVANDALAQYTGTSEARLAFWAHLPLQDPVAAAAEAERVLSVLGAKGFAIGGANLGGRELDDEAFFPLWEIASRYEVPIFVHGYPQAQARGKAGVTDRYDVTTMIGFMHDETACFVNLVCGGVLDRFPDLNVYITHGGGFVPYHLGRLETMIPMVADGKNERALHEYLPNFYFDLLLHNRAMRRAVVELVGPDQLVYGDNFNGSDWDGEEDLTADLGLTEDERQQVRSGNARKLLKL